MRTPSGTSTFGAVLRAFRTGAGLSQEQLADRAGVSLAAVSSLERGTRRAPQRATLELLASALDLSEEDRRVLKTSAGRVRYRGTGARRLPASNLPAYLTSFVARETELASIGARLAHDRLISIVGPGGIGKTRLACEIAARAANDYERVSFADLAPIRDGRVMVSRLAELLGATCDADEDALSSLVATVSRSRTLLILDNCEHLIESVGAVAVALLREHEALTIVATSRERIAVSGETVFRLDPLGTNEVDRDSAAVQLFVARARSAAPHVDLSRRADVIDICRRLDGLPLAIELAAAQLPSFGLEGLRTRLDRQFTLPTPLRDVPDRHRTMQNAIGWSFAMLSHDESVILQRVAIFLGGFTLEAAELVCSDAAIPPSSILIILSRLVERSLIHFNGIAGALRYDMLVPVRTYALEQLRESGDYDERSARHAAWLIELARKADTEAQFETTTRPVLESLSNDVDNINVALRRLLASGRREDTIGAAQLAGGLRLSWILSGRHDEGRAVAEQILAALELPEDDRVAAPLMRLLVQTSNAQPDDGAERAFAVFERLDDKQALASLTVHCMALAAHTREFERAEAMAVRADRLFAESTELSGRFYGMYLTYRSYLRAVQGRYDEALRDDARAVAFGCGEDRHRLEIRSTIDAGMGNYADAKRRLQEALPKISVMRTLALATNDAELIQLDEVTGAYEQSLRRLHRWLRLADHEIPVVITALAPALPTVVFRIGDVPAAAVLRGFVETLIARRRAHRTPLAEGLDRDVVDVLRARLGIEQFDRLTHEGARMTVHEVVAVVRRVVNPASLA